MFFGDWFRVVSVENVLLVRYDSGLALYLGDRVFALEYLCPCNCDVVLPGPCPAFKVKATAAMVVLGELRLVCL